VSSLVNFDDIAADSVAPKSLVSFDDIPPDSSPLSAQTVQDFKPVEQQVSPAQAQAAKSPDENSESDDALENRAGLAFLGKVFNSTFIPKFSPGNYNDLLAGVQRMESASSSAQGFPGRFADAAGGALQALRGALPSVSFDQTPYQTTPGDSTGEAFGTGAANAVRGLFTGTNAAIGAAVPELPAALKPLVSAYFAGSMTKEAASELGSASEMPAGPERTQAITQALISGGMGVLAATHAGSEISKGISETIPGKAAAQTPVAVDPELGIVRTPTGPLKVENGAVRPLTATEEQSAAALKGPEAIAPTTPTVTASVTEPNSYDRGKTLPEENSPVETGPLKVIDTHGLIPMHPEDFERESGQPVQDGSTPYRDPSTNQPLQIPDNSTPDQTKDIIDASRREEEMARNRGQYEDEADQSIQDIRLRVQQARADWVNNTAAEAYKAALGRDALRDQFPADPDRIEAYRDQLIADHRKALAGTLRDGDGNLIPPKPQSLIDDKVAAANEALQRARDLYTEPKKYGMVTEQETGEEPVNTKTLSPAIPVENDPDRLQVMHDDLLSRGLATEPQLENLRSRIRTLRGEPEPEPQTQQEAPPNTPPPEQGTVTAGEAPSGENYGITKADTMAMRERNGLPDRVGLENADWASAQEKAAQMDAEDRSAGPRLAKEMAGGSRRALNPEEKALLQNHYARTNEEYAKANDRVNEAVKSGDDVSQFKALADKQAKRDELHEAAKALERAGSMSGAALNAQKMVANSQFELGRMMAEREASKGSPLTEAEKDEAEVSAAKIKNDQEALIPAEAADQKRNADDATDAQIKQDKAEVAKEAPAPKRTRKAAEPAAAPGKIRTALNAEREAALARIKARSQKLYSNPLGVIPHLADEAIIGASHLANGIADFGEWSKKMIADLGEKIRPHLTALFEKSKQYLSTRDTLDSIANKMAARAANGEGIETLAPYIKRMGKELVRSGIDQRDDLVNALHDNVKDILKGVTKEQVRDAYSGYGDFRPLSKDEVDVKNRDLKGQLQQIGKLEDMQRGKAPSKSGPERRTPSDEERRLQQQVEQAKKIGGYQVTDPETQLRSTLQAHERQLANQIKDLTTEIDTGVRRTKTASPTNDRIEQLKAIRDRVRETRDAIFGQKGLTDEQRLKAATDAANRMADEYDRQVRQEDFRRSQGKPALTSPELEAAKARRDAARAQRDEYRALDKGFQDQQNAKRQTQLESQMAELDRRLKEGDLSQKAQAPKLEKTDALQDLKNQRDAMAQKLTDLKREAARPSQSELETRANARNVKAVQDQIVELDRKLKEGDVSVRQQQRAPASTELEGLRSQRDAMSAKLAELRRESNKLSPLDAAAKENARQLKAVQEQIAALDQRLKTGDLSTRTNATKAVSPEVEAARSQRDAMSRQLQEMRRDAAPKPTAAELQQRALDRANKVAKTRALNQLADLRDKSARGDFATPPKRVVRPPSPEVQKIRTELADEKRKWQEGNLKLESANRPAWQKAIDFETRFVRTGFLSTPAIIGKLGLAAAWRPVIGTGEIAANAFWRRALSQLAEGAPYRGGPMEAREATVMARGAWEGIRDSWNILKSGKSTISKLYGHNDPQAPQNIVFRTVSASHDVMKNPLKRAVLERSFIRRSAADERAGIDSTDPDVTTRNWALAYEDAQRSVLQQRSDTANAVNGWLKRNEMIDPKTGEPDLAKYLLAAAVKNAIPIRTVPLNFFKESGEIIGGLPLGLGEALKAYRAGMENVSPEMKDQILRHLNKGSVGLAAMVFGYAARNQIGGFFVRGQKNKNGEPEPGNIRIAGHDLPSEFTDSPLANVMNAAATFGHTLDREKGQDSRIPDALGASFLGLADRIPGAREMADFQNIGEKGGFGRFLGNNVASRAVPGIVRYGARLQDSKNFTPMDLLHPNPNERKPQTFPQYFEQSIPWLRQNVPGKPTKLDAIGGREKSEFSLNLKE
jgi:hypothetical protein